MVPRGRRPAGHAGAHALAAPARLPRLLDRARGPPRARCTSTSRCASRSCSTSRSPPRSRAAAGAPAGGRGSRARARSRSPAPALVDGLRAALDAHPRARHGRGPQRARPRARAKALAELADQLALPLLAEPLSGARRGPAAIAHYDALLRDPGFAAAHAPDLVLRFGDLPTSKPLRQWLHGLDALQIAFDAEAAWQDPAGRVGTIVTADPRVLAPKKPRKDRALARRAGAPPTAPPPTRSRARSATSPSRAWPPSSACGCRRDATLVVASSMPVRDVETFFPARDAPPRVLSNRGANGIDGTVSTAFGVAAAGTGPTVLLIGDVALAHDIGGLLAARRLGLPLVIVLLNNDGGGIFHFLPVEREGADFEEHVATPHGLDFAHAAALYGLGHVRVEDPAAFREALDGALAARDRHDPRGADRPRRERRAAPARVGGGGGIRPHRRLACRACRRA